MGDQRVAGWAGTGFGKADPAAGAAAALGFFGFGRIDLRSFGGGTGRLEFREHRAGLNDGRRR
jgi:hypothetical protein